MPKGVPPADLPKVQQNVVTYPLSNPFGSPFAPKIALTRTKKEKLEPVMKLRARVIDCSDLDEDEVVTEVYKALEMDWCILVNYDGDFPKGEHRFNHKASIDSVTVLAKNHGITCLQIGKSTDIYCGGGYVKIKKGEVKKSTNVELA